MRQLQKVDPFSLEWILSFKNPLQLWTENWFAFTLEVVSAYIVFRLFRNAKNYDPKSSYLLLAAATSVISFEILPCIPRPGYQLWWFHQGIVNVLKQRVPSYTFTIFALVHYMAHGLTGRSNLPVVTRSTITAICGTVIMFPCLWLAPRLLLVFLHFDDPVFKDQIAGVPYIQLLVMLLLFFHSSHLFHQNYASIEPQERNTSSYIKCAIQSGLVSGIYTIVEQYLLYILLTLICHANAGLCFLAAVLILVFLSKCELQEMQVTSFSIQSFTSPLMRKQFWIVFSAMIFIATLPLWLDTHSLKSTSDKLEMGPCHVTHEVSNTSPLNILRRRYVCPEDSTRLDFDFHCLTKEQINFAVSNKTKHYTVCGKHFENPFQIFKILTLYSTGCLALFYTMLLFSFTFKIQEEKIVENCKKVE